MIRTQVDDDRAAHETAPMPQIEIAAPQPIDQIAHADWSVNPKRRWLVRIERRGDSWQIRQRLCCADDDEYAFVHEEPDHDYRRLRARARLCCLSAWDVPGTPALRACTRMHVPVHERCLDRCLLPGVALASAVTSVDPRPDAAS